MAKISEGVQLFSYLLDNYNYQLLLLPSDDQPLPDLPLPDCHSISFRPLFITAIRIKGYRIT
ncbi:MAG: hypothetical protein ORN54_15375 [Cyclobacteriaceae bacterium]|nr:hypothetical protein [Cyclobacteriaceae bacterium]